MHRLYVWCWSKYYFQSLYSRGTWAMVKVVLWYIYSCQSVTSWDPNKMNSWDFASFTTCSFKEHILQSCKPSYSIWYIPSQYKLSVCIKVRFTYLQKICVFIREQRPTNSCQLPYLMAVQNILHLLFASFMLFIQQATLLFCVISVYMPNWLNNRSLTFTVVLELCKVKCVLLYTNLCKCLELNNF